MCVCYGLVMSVYLCNIDWFVILKLKLLIVVWYFKWMVDIID